MTTINGVDFYTEKDVIHSRGGFIVLNDKLDPCGVYLPAVKGFETFSFDQGQTTEMNERLNVIAENYRAMASEL